MNNKVPNYSNVIDQFESKAAHAKPDQESLRYFLVTGQASLTTLTLAVPVATFPNRQQLTTLFMKAYQATNAGTVPTRWAILFMQEVTLEEFEEWLRP